MPAITLKARWVFPVATPPLPDGTVTIEADRIAAVSPQTRTPDLDLGHAALLPGLVNAHTHLDLTGMRGLAPPSDDFVGWLRQVIAHRRSRTPEQVRGDIQAGLAECIRTGTTLLGDISSSGASVAELASAPLRSVVFHEMLGLTEERAAASAEALRRWLEAFPESTTCRPGVSPHAPYSIRWPLFLHAASQGIPLATHLAESPAELALLLNRTGPFVDFLRALNVWDPDGLAESPGHVLRLLRGTSPALLVHCNFLTADAPIPANGTIVYCPRTHAAFGFPPHPFRDVLRQGVRVALGTDSLASNPDLDLLAEARFLHRLHPDLPGEQMLRMATLAGAEALGWADQTGSLEAGKSADLVVVPLPSRDDRDPYTLLFNSEISVKGVMIRGQWVHGDPWVAA